MKNKALYPGEVAKLRATREKPNTDRQGVRSSVMKMPASTEFMLALSKVIAAVLVAIGVWLSVWGLSLSSNGNSEIGVPVLLSGAVLMLAAIASHGVSAGFVAIVQAQVDMRNRMFEQERN